MRSYRSYAAAALIATTAGLAIVLIAQKYPLPIYFGIIVSLFFSVAIPIAFLAARSQIRDERLHAAQVFRQTYGPCLSSNVFFEFIERKYSSGISRPAGGLAAAETGGKIPLAGMAGWLLAGAGLPFILFTAGGIVFLLLPAQEQVRLLGDSLGLSAASETLTQSKYYENSITIASLAFVSAFLYSLRIFFKSLASHSPFATAFLRAFAHMLFAVMLAIMIWRVAPDAAPLAEVASKVQNSIARDNKVTPRTAPGEASVPQSAAPDGGGGRMPKLWLALALAIGFIPDYAFSWLSQKTRLTLNRRYAKTGRHAAVTPLTVIDGIDFAKAFRLGEGNIASVENLAAANPVMLHVETSYCIFLIMDWIAQAQLCAAVGPERFFLFRRINVRTIFDLERAVLDPASPAGLKQIVGAVLFANDGTQPGLLREFGLRPLDMAHRDFETALASWVNAEVIEHLVRVIVDSLYIHRFRQLWQDIESSLAPAKAEKPQRLAAAKTQAAVVASPGQGNGGDRGPHPLDIAAPGKTAPAMHTEIAGD